MYFDDKPVVCSLSIACGAAGLLPWFGAWRPVISLNHSTTTLIHFSGSKKKNDTNSSWAHSGKTIYTCPVWQFGLRLCRASGSLLVHDLELGPLRSCISRWKVPFLSLPALQLWRHFFLASFSSVFWFYGPETVVVDFHCSHQSDSHSRQLISAKKSS